MSLEEKINNQFKKYGWSGNKWLEPIDDDWLTEDLAQYINGDLTVDFGYYGELGSADTGPFCIYLIKNENWEEYEAKFEFSAGKMALLALLQMPEFCLKTYT